MYMPLRRKTGSLSVDKLVTKASLSSRRLNIVNAMPTAKPRNIFSCWVSCAYWKKIDTSNYLRNWRNFHLLVSRNLKHSLKRTFLERGFSILYFNIKSIIHNEKVILRFTQYSKFHLKLHCLFTYPCWSDIRYHQNFRAAKKKGVQ